MAESLWGPGENRALVLVPLPAQNGNFAMPYV
jgi:hypothetical protein